MFHRGPVEAILNDRRISADSEPLTMPRQTTKRPPPKPSGTRYEDDLYSWVQEQMSLLRSGRLDEVDALNIAEELSDVGNQQLDKLESAIALLTLHVLKWEYQPERRSRSWQLSVREPRRRIHRVLKKSPGLKPLISEAIQEGYADGRDRALDEAGLPDEALPEACPDTFDEMMTRAIVFRE